MRERLSQRRHAGKMERHVTERCRRRPAFVQRDRHVVVSDRDPIVELEFLLQPEHALEPFRASFRTPYRQSEMTDDSDREWNLRPHVIEEMAATVSRRLARPASPRQRLPRPRKENSVLKSRPWPSQSDTRR